MMENIKRIIYSERQIKRRVRRLGRQISRDYKDGNLLVVCVMKGSLIFTADLMRYLTVPCKLDFIQASSYGNDTVSSGQIKILKDLDTKDVTGLDLLVIEDIIDSGNTLAKLREDLEKRCPRSLRICTLLDKKDKHPSVSAEYVGFELEGDPFVVGYGLDYAQDYRNLPFIGDLRPEAVK